MLVTVYFFLFSRATVIPFIQTYSATSLINPHWEMDKTFSPSYSLGQITYVEAEGVEFSRFRFHRKRTASTASSFQLPLPHPWYKDYAYSFQNTVAMTRSYFKVQFI